MGERGRGRAEEPAQRFGRDGHGDRDERPDAGRQPGAVDPRFEGAPLGPAPIWRATTEVVPYARKTKRLAAVRSVALATPRPAS